MNAEFLTLRYQNYISELADQKILHILSRLLLHLLTEF